MLRLFVSKLHLFQVVIGMTNVAPGVSSPCCRHSRRIRMLRFERDLRNVVRNLLQLRNGIKMLLEESSGRHLNNKHESEIWPLCLKFGWTFKLEMPRKTPRATPTAWPSLCTATRCRARPRTSGAFAQANAVSVHMELHCTSEGAWSIRRTVM